MEGFSFCSAATISSILKSREGETKFGEQLTFINSMEELANHEAPYVIFGIPEDIGVRANLGQKGTADAWNDFLKAFVNIQVNRNNNPSQCLVLGNVDCDSLMEEAEKISDAETLGSLVKKIDKVVAKVVKQIIASGKTPIIIGGGHNNCYGNIKGASKAMERPIHVLNVDAHTDLRNADHRHSGNGFRYALRKGFLDRYAMVGIHKNYTPEYIFKEMDEDKKVSYSYFEDFLHLTTVEKLIKFKKATDFVKNHFGLEIDCDSIKNFNSSAITSTGFNINEVRSFIKLSKKQKVIYLHLCEAIPTPDGLTGKTLSYFVSDFIREE